MFIVYINIDGDKNNRVLYSGIKHATLEGAAAEVAEASAYFQSVSAILCKD